METDLGSPAVLWQGEWFDIYHDSAGGSQVARSTNAIGWRIVASLPFGDRTVDFLIATSAGLVAISTSSVGEALGVWMSADGLTWTAAADISALAGAYVESVAGGPLGVVVVGWTNTHQPAIWFSETGSSWQKARLSASGNTIVRYVDVMPGGFEAMGVDGWSRPVAWWSHDGRNWSKASVSGDGVLVKVHAAAHGLLAAGLTDGGDTAQAAAWASADGRSWRQVARSAVDGTLLTKSEPALGALISDGARIISVAPDYCTHVDEADDHLCKYWQTGGVWESLDGTTWHQLRSDLGLLATNASWSDPWPWGYLLPDGLVTRTINDSWTLVAFAATAVP